VGSDSEQALRDRAADLLTSGRVELVVGYGKSYVGDGVRPVFVRSPAEAGGMIWDERCAANLATFLMKEPCLRVMAKGGKVGIVAKGCDARAIAVLLQEKQLDRDKLHVFGVVCNGVADEGAGPGIEVKCRSCEVQVPPVYDDLIGAESDVRPIEGIPREDVERVLALGRADRWQFWTHELSRCVKCYACRQACPLCYCGECITEKTRPQWIERAASLRGNIAFHYIRAMHLAGRCVSCGECARACPMGIPVDLLTRHLSRRVRESYDYAAGMDPDAEPFYLAYRDDDPGDFIR
jgi:ferredoxin